MRIAILCVGSTGDVRPCVVLSQGLIKRNHSVTIIADERFRDSVTSCGAEFAAFPGNVDEYMDIVTNPENAWYELLSKMREYIAKLNPEIEKVLLENFEGKDLILYSAPSSSMAVYIAEKFKIPYARIGYFPDMKCSDFTQYVFPKLPLPGPMKRHYNRTTLDISYYNAANMYKKALGNWFKKHDLPKTKYFYNRSDGKVMDQIMAYSNVIMPRPKEYGDNVHICGYFFEDKDNLDYTPDSGLLEFINAGPAPVYLGFGSMSSGSFDELRSIIVEALKISGKRAIISKGWGGFSEENLPDNIYMVGYCPHDWLFEQVSAVVHHGGAGTTAAALRAGKPALIVPFGGDQQFWGERIYSMGCGPKFITRKKLNAQNLANALLEMDSPEMQQKAREVAEMLSKENGVETACDCIEKIAAEGWINNL